MASSTSAATSREPSQANGEDERQAHQTPLLDFHAIGLGEQFEFTGPGGELVADGRIERVFYLKDSRWTVAGIISNKGHQCKVPCEVNHHITFETTEGESFGNGYIFADSSALWLGRIASS